MNLAAARQMRAPDHVLNNFQGQIDDYKKVVDQMREDLAELPEDEREGVEVAAVVLRRARAAANNNLALTLLTTTPEARDTALKRLHAASDQQRPTEAQEGRT
jgi:hypothetical protein